MRVRTQLAAFPAVIAAVAVGLPVASAGAATTPPIQPAAGDTTPACPLLYVKNLATGCAPWWQIEYGMLTNPYYSGSPA
jgi:hypothetical protein